MAGIYIHIPFCKKACHYCDFHFSTNLRAKNDLVNAIAKEIALRKEYLTTPAIETIYFGGGTPSLLNESELEIIFNAIHKNFQLEAGAEITLEANPDDITPAKINLLKQFPFNRISIGIQSFYGPHLKWMNRAHNETEAVNSVKIAQDGGFNNITIDLIYSIPSSSHQVWENDLTMATKLRVQHISAYSLTIEPKTVFGKQQENGKLPGQDEDFMATQYEMLIEYLSQNNFEQYEISNFSLPGFYARHNSNYWNRKNYLGLGPSAHSFNGHTRQWNISSNALYISSIDIGKVPATIENLTATDLVNEYLLTSLRTKWGADINEIEKIKNVNFLQINNSTIEKYIKTEMLNLDKNILTLTEKGKLLADGITADLFLI